MLPTNIETAVPLGFDLEEPLISHTHDHRDDDDDNNEEKDLQFDDECVNDVHHYFHVLGCLLGFLLQCVSLGATAVLAVYWDNIPANSSSIHSQFFYWTIYGLSQSWLLLFPVVCLAIERSWKVSGIRFLQTYFLDVKEPTVTEQTRKMTFVASVRFLIGVVHGCFLTWALVDLYLGASITMLSSLIVSMIVCLALCHAMIVLYDSFSWE